MEPFNDSHKHAQNQTHVIELQFDQKGILRSYHMSGCRDIIAYEKISAAIQPARR
jgi:hypothetical protein